VNNIGDDDDDGDGDGDAGGESLDVAMRL